MRRVYFYLCISIQFWKMLSGLTHETITSFHQHLAHIPKWETNFINKVHLNDLLPILLEIHYDVKIYVVSNNSAKEKKSTGGYVFGSSSSNTYIEGSNKDLEYAITLHQSKGYALLAAKLVFVEVCNYFFVTPPTLYFYWDNQSMINNIKEVTNVVITPQGLLKKADGEVI
mmetsp:Transcript_16606/g.23569  ORF Transcript_16606/g.23569 Transcript_16606/m.23569 type:complete len:171 (-) Transcript_16606:64-576(-)|eukprot:CAMPEP_0184870090 /NCGR_PEP_ID=MMETSP0580-20130426/36431_1 /TAXON_ID=1118495 /ORGANISM="Dactyliosolen fragilissimus" /LENGTH=170 /DNA_ID=CAMNT_0027372001 /DNA_START=133 /DNA_END=645 /DNA_ORIENTATION=-